MSNSGPTGSNGAIGVSGVSGVVRDESQKKEGNYKSGDQLSLIILSS
jgi:hypothetical protein